MSAEAMTGSSATAAAPPMPEVRRAPIRLVEAPSVHPGMGAMLHEGGCTFRVWAPNAEEVWIAGNFTTPEWSAGKIRLERDSAGASMWSAFVPRVMAGDEYRFVIRNPWEPSLIWKLDPHCRDITYPDHRRPDHKDFDPCGVVNSVVCDPTYDWSRDRFQMPILNELVVYEMHTATFYDRPQDLVGQFRRLIDRLDHLKDLGVNAVEIVPARELWRNTGMGYNVSLPFAVENAFDQNKVFQELVTECHSRGMAVLIDVSYNRFGPDHLNQCLWRFDGWYQNDMGGVYFYNDPRAWTPWGDKNRPDYGREEVFEYLRDNAMMWLEEYRADGLRWDSALHIRTIYGRADGSDDIPDGWRLMQRINDEIRRRQPWKLSIAEDMRQNEWITRSTAEGGAGFNAQWDMQFAQDIYSAILPVDDAHRNMVRVKEAIERKFNGRGMQRVIFTESHHEVKKYWERDHWVEKGRVPNKIWWTRPDSLESRKRSTLGAAIAMTSPGVPMLFQGQEFLASGSWHENPQEGGALDWTEKDRFPGIFAMYCDLVRLRRNWYDNTRGLRGENVNVFHVNYEKKLIAYHRWDAGGAGDDVVVVANFSGCAYDNYNIGLPREGAWRLRFNSDWSGYSSDFGNIGHDTYAAPGGNQGMAFNGNVSIGPYSAIILSQ